MLKEKQKKALKKLKAGQNVFLTGEAGTGKSYVIDEFISYAKDKDKNVLVVAPTGLAALNVGGATIHRTFKAPIGAILHQPMEVPKVVQKADIIIMDEVSMCRRDLFTWVARMILKASKFKGRDIQFVVVGDFLQLPPVLTEKDNEILKYTTAGYAFEANEWGMFDFVTVSLDEGVRQTDTEFLTNLNKARIGDITCLDWINNNHNKKEQEKAIFLCGTNKKTDQINKDSLDALNSKEWKFSANEKGIVTEQDRPAPSLLKIKEGARVMSVVNSEKYVNGSLGTVKKITENMIIVDFDEAGTQEIKRYEWAINEYQVNEDTGKIRKKEIGTYEQFPFKLAYAITIHKSQGQTYDAVNLYPYCFAPGQLYVALSRCKTINKLHLMSQIKSSNLITSKEVLDFYKEEKNKNVKEVASLDIKLPELIGTDRQCEYAKKLREEFFKNLSTKLKKEILEQCVNHSKLEAEGLTRRTFRKQKSAFTELDNLLQKLLQYPYCLQLQLAQDTSAKAWIDLCKGSLSQQTNAVIDSLKKSEQLLKWISDIKSGPVSPTSSQPLHPGNETNETEEIEKQDVITTAISEDSQDKQEKSKGKRGGKREGAGRKQKYDCKTVTMRVPEDMVDKIKAFIQSEMLKSQEK